MSQLVTRVGIAIDAAKKGKRPSTSTRRNAELGEPRAMIEVCAFEFANANPCGCNDHHEGELDEGFSESLSLDDDTDLLIPN